MLFVVDPMNMNSYEFQEIYPSHHRGRESSFDFRGQSPFVGILDIRYDDNDFPFEPNSTRFIYCPT